jgi:hypothetical protein
MTANVSGLNAGVYYATNVCSSPQATNGSTQWVVRLTVDQASQTALTFNPPATQIYGTTNVLSVTGGTGSGAVSFQVLSGPGTIIGGSNLVMTTGSGTVVVQATKASETNYTSVTATANVQAAKVSQTITLNSIPAQKQTNTVALSATASSGLPVGYAVQAGPGTITGSTLSFTGGGTVLVVATQSGNDLYAAAPDVMLTIAVTALVQSSIASSASTMTLTAPYGSSSVSPAGVSVSNSGEQPINYSIAVNYSSLGSGWLAVSPTNGTVPPSGSVNVSMTANVSGLNAGVYYATNVCSSPQATNGSTQWVVRLTVDQASQAALTFTPPATQTYGTTNALSVTGGTGSGAVSFKVLSGPGTILGGSNLVMTSGSGTVVVQATKASETNYSSTNATATVQAVKASQKLSFPTIASQKNTNTVVLTASATSDLPVNYAVLSGPGVLSGGVLKFSWIGTVQVVASQDGDDNYQGASPVTNSVVVTSYLQSPSNLHVTGTNN